MTKKLLIGFLVSVISLAGTSAMAQSAPSSDAEKIKAKVTKIGIGNEVTVIVLNRDEYHGSISSVDSNSFTIDEVDLKQPIVMKYAEVKKVQTGYGHSRDWTGRRIPPRKHAIGLAIAAAAILIPVILVVGARN